MQVDGRIIFRALAFALTASVLLSSCVSLPTAEELDRAPSPHLTAHAPSGIVDGRSEFRRLFCESLEEHPEDAGVPVSCDFWLHRLEDEPPAAVPGQAVVSSPLQVLLVTGAFSECFGEDARPFGSAIGPLRDQGYRIDTVVVGGRSGTAHNAREIAVYLAEWPVRTDMPLVLIGYSKGASDILQFLVDYPEQASKVDAVVSVAGSIGGSPIAETFDGLYDFLFSHLPSGHCPAGDGDVVHSLRRDIRDQWLQDNELPSHVRYYSLAAFTTRERVARALVRSWKTLLEYDRHNDGQLLVEDALIPGSTLLGYLDADHWAVALDIEDDSPLLAHREIDAHFPHLALLQAVLLQVSEDAGE
jgi:dienelactone hydrolase